VNRSSSFIIITIGFFLLLAWEPCQGYAASTGLESVKDRLSGSKVVHADFKQTKKIDALEKPIHSLGRVVVHQDRGVLWYVESPYKVTFIITQGAFKELHADGTIRDRGRNGARSRSQVSGLFQALFTGDISEMQKYFEISATTEDDHWTLELQPKEIMDRYLDGVLVSGADYVGSLLVEEAGGDSVEVIFSNQTSDVPLTEEEEQLLGME